VWACLRRRLLSLKYLRVIALAVRLKSVLVTAACASEMLPLNCDPRVGEMSIWSHQTDKASFAKGSILFLVSVALVAAVEIVLFSVVSISLLGASKETLTLFRSHNSHLEDKVIGALVSHMDSDASQVPAQTKSPSASTADNMSSSTPVLPSSGMLTEKTFAAPALKPTTDREASTTAIKTSNGSTRAPSTDEMPAPEPSPSQEVRASPASIVEGTPTVETSNGSTRAPSTDEMPAPEPSPSQEVRASPASIVEGTPTVETSNGSTRAPSTNEMPAPEPSPSQEVRASPASIVEGTPTVETSNGSTRAPSTNEMPAPEPSPSQEVRASPASIVDAGNPAQDDSGAIMPALAISHEQRDQRFQNFEKQRQHANHDEGSVAFASEIDFPKKTQIKESKGSYGSSTGPESKSPVRHAAPHGRGAKAGNIADKLNHAELSRLVQRSRVLR